MKVPNATTPEPREIRDQTLAPVSDSNPATPLPELVP